MNINELPTLTYHFFEKPNKLTITNEKFTTIIETEFECEDDFVLDAQSFDMLKKLGGPIKINNTTINFNKYKCQKLDIIKPDFTNENILFTQNYEIEKLKNAIKYVNHNFNQPILCGVLLNDNGDIFATDSFKFYFKREKNNYNNMLSIPIDFINLLPNDEKYVNLSFTNNKIIYNGKFKMYNNIYGNETPKIENLCDNFNTLYTINITNKPELTYLPCEIVKIEINNGVHFIFDNNEKSFVVDYDLPTNFNFECYITYTNLLSFLSDNMQIDFSNNMLRVNNEIIICYIRR